MPKRNRSRGNWILANAIALALSAAQNNAANAAEEATKLEAVIVSGSRIPQNELDAPAPTVSISSESIELSGTTNLTDFLASQPALTGSVDSSQTSGSQGFIGSAGLNLLNLRNLGTERTLVLVDGRRHVGQLPETAAVDVNTIPADLVERIDIVTGGVSAVYGADGVSGVVNFVMKKDFEGLKARLQYGAADNNGKPVDWLASVVGGFNFADGRGNVSVALEHRSEGRLQATDRDYLKGERYTTLHLNPDDSPDDPNVPDNIPLSNIRFFDSSREGGIDLDFDGIPDVRPNGQPYDIPRFIDPFYSQGGSGTLQADYIGDLLARNDTTVANVFARFDLNDSVKLFTEIKYVWGSAFTASQPTFDYYIFLDQANPYIPAGIAAQIDPTLGGILVNRDNFDLGVRGEDIERNTLRAVAGVSGDIFSDFDYEVSYVYGESRVHTVATNNRFNDRFFAALDVVTNPGNGQPTCRSNLDPTALPFQPFQGFDFSQYAPGELTFTPGPNSGCIPLNILGEGVANPAAIDWVFNDSVTRSKLTQNVVTAFVRGPIPGFELPAGPIDVVFGVEWRRETSRTDTPREDQAGLTFGNAIFPTSGEFDVSEAFAEFRVPVLKELPALELLQFNGAIRVSDYSTVGSTTTWNFGTTWKPIVDVGLRAMYAESVRAPNIAELFNPQSQDFQFIDDPCDINALNNGSAYRAANCAAILTALGQDPTTYTDPNSASVPGLQKGNANLSEETAKSYTFGAVLQPRFAPGLALTIDYYDINITGAISTAEPQEVADNCVDQPTIDNVFCDALTRSATTGGIINFLVQPENVAQFRTRGIDFSVRYVFSPADFGADADVGKFSLSLIGNRLDRLTTIPSPGAEQIDQRTTQFAPKWQTTFDLVWTFKAVTVAYGFNYFGETTRFTLNELRGDPDIASRDNIYFDERKTHDLTVAFDFTERLRAYVGGENLTDQKPDLATFYPVSPIGRFFFAGVRASL